MTAVLLIWGITWGFPAKPEAWAPDEINPFMVRDGWAQSFSNGWVQTYPPFHFYVLALVQLPAIWLESIGRYDLHDLSHYNRVFLAQRLASVVMALGIVWLTYRCARLFTSRAAAVVAAALVGLTPTFVFYGKLANVDVPSAFWFMLSTWFFLRALDTGRTRDHLYWAIASAMAIGTKDQVAGLIIAMPIVLAVRSYRRWRFWLAMLTFAIALALIHNVIWNWAGFVERMKIVTAPAAIHAARYGYRNRHEFKLAVDALATLHWFFGWPGVVALFAGALDVLRRLRVDPRPLLLFLPCVTFWLVVVTPIGYHIDRYFLPLAPLMAIVAGQGAMVIVAWLRSHVQQWVVMLSVAAIVTYQVGIAASVDWLMTHDSRPIVDAWAQDHLSPSSRIVGIGPPMYLPRLTSFPSRQYVMSPRLNDLNDRADVLIGSSAAGEGRFKSDPAGLDAIHRLQTGATRFVRVFSFQTRQPVPLLIMPERVRTNLDKINPRIDVYIRSDAVSTVVR